MEKVIAISRQHGSGGRQIGRLLSKELGIPFYDREIIKQAAEDSGIHSAHFTEADLKRSSAPSYLLSPGVPFELPFSDKVYLAQRSAILNVASQGPCVIVGRGASEVLQGKVPVLRVFIYADIETRIQRAIKYYHEPEENIEKHIRQIDKKRMSYYSFYEKREAIWTEHFDLCINSGVLGIEKTAKLIADAYRNLSLPNN